MHSGLGHAMPSSLGSGLRHSSFTRKPPNLSPYHSWSSGSSLVSKSPQPLEGIRITWGDGQGCRFRALGVARVLRLWTRWEKPSSSAWSWLSSALTPSSPPSRVFWSHSFFLLHGLWILKFPLGSSFLLLVYYCFISHLFHQFSQGPSFLVSLIPSFFFSKTLF